MGVRVEQADLPGIGVRYDVVTSAGRRVSVLSHRSGERTIAIVDADDPDACTESVALTDDEAAALAEVLGPSVMLGQLADLSKEAAGLFTEKISLPSDSPYVNRQLGHTKARTRTGVSIVAVVRDGRLIPSPGPELVFTAGDKLVAVGTRAGLDSLSRIIADGTA